MSEFGERQNLDHLARDTWYIDQQLGILNELHAELASVPVVSDIEKQVVRDEIVDQQLKIDEQLLQLNQGYANFREMVRWSQVAAHAINVGGSPGFLNGQGINKSMRTQGFFDGFQLLYTPSRQRRLYMRAVLGIQVFWAQPVSDNVPA